ncbi:MAG: hypothetical protein V1886_03695 [archaeon]
MPRRLLGGKRGLLKFVIGLIVGILCIIPLLYLGSSLSSIFFSTQKEVLQAQGTLEELYNTVDMLGIGESTPSPVLVYAPAGWWILSFDKYSNPVVGLRDTEVKRKAECTDKVCLCLCRDSADCTKNSACREFPKPLKTWTGNLAEKINLLKLGITNEEDKYHVWIANKEK